MGFDGEIMGLYDHTLYDAVVAAIAGECRVGDEEAIRRSIWDYLDQDANNVLVVLRCADLECMREVYDRDGWGLSVRAMATETMLVETVKVQDEAFYESDALINEALDREARS